MYSHSFAIFGLPEPKIFNQYTLGLFCVFIFFITSGFLIFRSWIRRPSIRWYVVSRLLRIFPALIGVVVFCVLIVGPLATRNSLPTYFFDSRIFTFFKSNVIFFVFDWQQTLPGVFEKFPVSQSVNGSLWTIPFELFMYFLLLLTVLPGVIFSKQAGIKTASFLVIIFLIFYTVGYILNTKNPGLIFEFMSVIGLGFPLLILGGFFATGVLYAYAEDHFFHPIVAMMLLLLCFVLTEFRFFQLILLLFIPYIVISLAQSKLFSKIDVFYKHDLSYGIYLYAFPIQQLTYYFFGSRINQLTGFALSFTLTVLMAVISWFLIERPSLRLKAKFGVA
jgi:peptidoglycan/LPS O-acetylase OafA/YrhL